MDREIIYCEDCKNFRSYGGASHGCEIGILDNPSERDFCSKAIEKARWIIETMTTNPSMIKDGIKTMRCSNCNKYVGYYDERTKNYKYCPYCGIKLDGFKDPIIHRS